MSNDELEREKLQLEIENLKLEQRLTLIRIQAETAEAQHDASYSLPHRRYHTQVYESPNDACWICVPYSLDRGDMYLNYPHGIGSTPAKACEDFDRNWNGESRDDTQGDYFA